VEGFLPRCAQVLSMALLPGPAKHALQQAILYQVHCKVLRLPSLFSFLDGS